MGRACRDNRIAYYVWHFLLPHSAVDAKTDFALLHFVGESGITRPVARAVVRIAIGSLRDGGYVGNSSGKNSKHPKSSD